MLLLKTICFLLIFYTVSCQDEKEISLDPYIIRVGGERIQVWSNKDGKRILHSEFSSTSHDLQQPFVSCETSSTDGICLQWTNEKNVPFTVRIKPALDHCLETIGTSPDPLGALQLTYYYDGSEWYGGPERYNQIWPVQNLVMDNLEPMTTRSENSQGVVEPYWITSTGQALYVTQNTTLFFASNRNESALELQSRNAPPYKPNDEVYFHFYECYLQGPREAHLFGLQNFLGKPSKHPGERMMTYPTYSTWAKYKSDINQAKVKEFTDAIIAHDFLLGQIEIDDKWETCYGSLEFDTEKFPNVTELTDYIHSKGGKVTAWVHPFINTDCPLYQQALNEGRLVLSNSNSSITSWWNGQGGIVDVTNSTTRDWWVQRLRSVLESSGLDGFKFDAGESGWCPQLPQITGDPSLYPDFYVRNYVEVAAEFGSDIEVRVGRQTQDVPLFIRMLDKDSRWGLDNGLQSVITTAFEMGLAGYAFILPDMIGGNAYGSPPSKELFIRWVEVNALLPAMQFSLLPWDFDEETSEISKTYLNLHTNYSQVLLEASSLTLSDGRPIIAPLWFYAPSDPLTYRIIDEFFVGEKTLVAPVVTEGAVTRDVYLPTGIWTDTRNQKYDGPTRLLNYSAPLDFLPIFTKS